jgi:hypothetical protein
VKQTPVWPAYFVTAACFAIVLLSSIANISLFGRLKQEERRIANVSQRSNALARSVETERTALFDLVDADARHYAGNGGEVIVRESRTYVVLRALPQPPRGKIYQAWALANGSKAIASSMFSLFDLFFGVR